MSKRIMPPLILICTLITIVCIPVIARGSITANDISIPTLASNTKLFENEVFNEYEKDVLNMLLNLQGRSDGSQSMYVNYLVENLSSSKIDLSKGEADQVIDKIKSMNEIMNIEKVSDIKKMSLDGRGIEILLSEQVYKICGLNLIHNMQGDIVMISDTTDTILYINENTNKKVNFHLNVLIIILIILIILLVICIVISKKNQLFLKDGRYDGFVEKGFA